MRWCREVSPEAVSLSLLLSLSFQRLTARRWHNSDSLEEAAPSHAPTTSPSWASPHPCRHPRAWISDVFVASEGMSPIGRTHVPAKRKTCAARERTRLGWSHCQCNSHGMSASAADAEQWALIGGEWGRARRVPANLAPHVGAKCPWLGRGKPS